MNKMVWAFVAGLCLTACDDQRDLYATSQPMLYVEADWMPSLGTDNMSQRATAMIYKTDHPCTKEYFHQAKCMTTRVTAGQYDILLFNGLMYSPSETHLDNIYFTGTEGIETFQAHAQETSANKRLTKQANEIIASNEMEILTSIHVRKEVKGDKGYYLKYKNGKNGFPVIPDYVEDSLFLTPYPVSYEAQIVVDLINPSSAYVANGALRGFAGSVFMATRMPSQNSVTHQFKLNSLRITDEGDAADPLHPERGSIESPVFITFGPPLDVPERKYEFEISIVLKDGSEVNKVLDVTDQVTPVINQIKAHLMSTNPVPIKLTIPIHLTVELPIISSTSGGSIGVDDWGDDEIIRFPIK